jgi:putative oxidoreductase
MDLRPPTFTMLRVIPALLFMEHGVQKTFGLLGGFGQPGATAPLFSLMGLASILESFGGLLFLLGLFTRPVAVLLFCEMMIAYGKAHAPEGFWPLLNHGELALLYGIIFLFFAAHGGGPVSLDAWRLARSASNRDSRSTT